MRKAESGRGGFSLMEVVTALGVISFALVGLVGMLPVAMDNSRASVSETRAAQLAGMVISTLRSERFTAAACFSPNLPPLNLADLAPAVDAAPGAVLYASYDVQQSPQIIRATTQPAEAIYRIELHFHPEVFASSKPPRVTGSTVRLRITGLNARQAPVFETATFIGNFQRVPFAK